MTLEIFNIPRYWALTLQRLQRFVIESWKKTPSNFDSFILPKFKGGEETAMLFNVHK